MRSIKTFLGATARGYEYAASHPQEAAALLVKESKGALDKDFAVKSQEFVSKVRDRQIVYYIWTREGAQAHTSMC